MSKYPYKYNGAIPDNIWIVVAALVLVVAVAVIAFQVPAWQRQQVRARLQQLTATPTPTVLVEVVPATRTPRPTTTPNGTPTSALSPEVVAARVATALDQAETPWNKGTWLEVIHILAPVYTLAPQNITVTEKLYTAHFKYGQALLALGDKPGAVEHFVVAVELKPTSEEAKTALYALATPTPVYVPPPPPIIQFTPPGRRPPPAPTPRRRP